MKMKHINKILASALSVSMLMGGTLPALAAEGEVDAPIYSLDVIDVIVPTTYAVAFNPEELQVKTGDSTNSNAQILSKNFGIINKSSKDKLIKVSLNVEDLNNGSGITFVDTEQDVDDAADGEYKIHLTVIPADGTEVKVSGNPATQTTAASDLNDVVMTGADSKAVTLKAGANLVGFKLDKATWTPKTGADVTLGTTNSNNVSSNYEVTALATGGKGITAFTFGGKMNKNADWFKLTKGIKITVVYDSVTASSDTTTVSGTGAMVTDIAPTFATGRAIGQINYSAGIGDNGLNEIKKVEMRYTDGNLYDIYHASGANWPAATDESGVITLSSQALALFKSFGPVVETIVTYETNNGTEKTAKVNVLLEIVSEAPTFTTGSGIGQINYTTGFGDDGLNEITKIEMPYAGDPYDVYHGGSSWSAATDEDGVITLASDTIALWAATGATFEAKVTYVTNSGETRTASLNVNVQ